MVLKTWVYFHSFVANGLRREEGQTMAEYGVVLAVICIAAIAALALLRDEIVKAIKAVVTTLQGA